MGRKFMANHLPPLPPRDYVRAQQTRRPVGDFVPGGPLRPDQMIPPHVSADKMVWRKSTDANGKTCMRACCGLEANDTRAEIGADETFYRTSVFEHCK